MRTEITIVYENGQTTVNGPLSNKMLCYGMLESAKMIVAGFDPSKKIIPARAHEIPNRNGGGKAF